MKCPCEICLVRAMCQKRQIWNLLNECQNLYDFLVAETPDHYDNAWLFYTDHFFLVCDLLSIGIRKGTFHEQNMSVSDPIDNTMRISKL